MFVDREMKFVDKDTILATNTSSFSVTELSKSVSNPQRFIGLHYFYHAEKNRLVEIIPDLDKKYSKKIYCKAPVALKTAKKLINEAAGNESELKELKMIFSTEDALTGLSSIGKKVEFKSK